MSDNAHLVDPDGLVEQTQSPADLNSSLVEPLYPTIYCYTGHVTLLHPLVRGVVYRCARGVAIASADPLCCAGEPLGN
jgi:hypothetical protein